MARAKFIDQHNLQYPPSSYVYNNMLYVPVTDEILELDGWKLIVETPAPECEQDKHAEMYWEDGEGVITKKYNIVDDAPGVIIARLKDELAHYDYIGVKIAMGVATREEYATEIAYTETLRVRIRELENLLNESAE